MRTLGDEAAPNLEERLLARSLEGEMVEASTLEHRLPARHTICWNLERMQRRVLTDRYQCVPPSAVLAVTDNARVENTLVEPDEPIQVRREERDVMKAVDERHRKRS